jgi:hypothetical protein
VTDEKGPGGRDDARPFSLSETEGKSVSLTKIVQVPQRRRRLPNRRASESFDFKIMGLRFVCTVGFFSDGTIGEIFLTNHRVNSGAGIMASDQAVLASLALQYGCPLETLSKALMRDSAGRATSPIGRALDFIAEQERGQ